MIYAIARMPKKPKHCGHEDCAFQTSRSTIAAWVIGDIDAAQKHDTEHSAAHLSERARLEADPATRRRSVEARRPLHRPLCQDLPLNKRRSSE